METTLAQIAHEQTRVPLKDIRVTLGDTANTPFSTGAYASRGIVMSGGAVSVAAEIVAGRIKSIAAHLLQVSAEDVSFRDGGIFAGAASVSYEDVGRAWYMRPDQLPDNVDRGGLEATGAYKPTVDTGVFSYASHAAYIAVDAETGLVEILDYAICEDCGTMVNPMIVDGQTIGGAAQGVGTALFEESPYDDNGQPLASTLIDYLLPGPTELPRFRIMHMETPSPFSAHGLKGVGEGGAIAPSAALVNAINDAMAPLGATIMPDPGFSRANPRRHRCGEAKIGQRRMKPAPLEYVRPRSLQEAVGLLSDEAANAKVFAGGQSLGPMLNLRLARPATLVDIRHIPELRAVRARFKVMFDRSDPYPCGARRRRDRGFFARAVAICGAWHRISGGKKPRYRRRQPGARRSCSRLGLNHGRHRRHDRHSRAGG